MRRPRLEVLDKGDVRQIIEAAYDLLENFGVNVNSEPVLRLFADSGARVNFDQKVAYVLPAMVDKALESVPSSFSVYDHEGKNAAALEGDTAFLCRFRRIEYPGF